MKRSVANAEILEHARKREIEVKVFELRDSLEEGGFDEAEIEKRCDELRESLQGTVRSARPTKESHSIAREKEAQNERLRNAFKLSKDYVEGAAFDRELQQKLKMERQASRETKRAARPLEEGEETSPKRARGIPERAPKEDVDPPSSPKQVETSVVEERSQDPVVLPPIKQQQPLEIRDSRSRRTPPRPRTRSASLSSSRSSSSRSSRSSSSSSSSGTSSRSRSSYSSSSGSSRSSRSSSSSSSRSSYSSSSSSSSSRRSRPRERGGRRLGRGSPSPPRRRQRSSSPRRRRRSPPPPHRDEHSRERR